MKRYVQTIIPCFLLMFASSAYATTVTYILDQSNELKDGVDYLSVTLSDETDGQLDFWVEILPSLSDMAGGNFGIQSFAFNYSDFISDVTGEEAISSTTDRILANSDDSDFILPDTWKVQTNKGMSEAGKFDVRLMGRGNSRQDPLHFSILGVGLDDVSDFFAAHIAGFELPGGECADEHEGYDECGMDETSSAFFFGGRLVEEPPPIPVPAAVWLFGSGLLALTGIARRNRRG